MEIAKMPFLKFEDYYTAIDIIYAQERLDRITDSNFSDFKKEVKSKIKNDLEKRAKDYKKSGPNISNSEAAAIMARRMLEVKNGR